MYSPPFYSFRSSLFFELLLLLDRLVVNWLGPPVYAFLLFYKCYVRNLSIELLLTDVVFYLSLFYVNWTRVAAGSAGNKSGTASLIGWFWALWPFSFAAHVNNVCGLPLVLTVDIVFSSFALVLAVLQLIWSIVTFLLSNTSEECETSYCSRSASSR
ncbi:hypothetical protein BESB_027790 [Besnoitia besnoiti]|uniref:Transmembrane protein n=1 Tax=Besnoitia besnoiti TaxID=94643 RepID=A0A2A9M285_BESBE|nr:uncharacterized protein BESB_027790 [Besnoitia besnoiti]PFH31344.1 hypothetical protein BESB_027790 [Besnoitia besnoiti]